jgi:hypothetical protein
MLYREIIAVCSQIHTKHTNALCGQNVELLNVKLAVHIVTTGLLSREWSDTCRGRTSRLSPFCAHIVPANAAARYTDIHMEMQYNAAVPFCPILSGSPNNVPFWKVRKLCTPIVLITVV